MRTLTLALSTLLLTTLAASAQSPKAGPGKLNPCAVLTKAEVQAALGGTVGNPALNQHNSTVCDFTSGVNMLGVMAAELRPGDTMEKMMAELKKRNIQSQPATGIGDRAFFANAGYGMQQLCVYKGTRYLILTTAMAKAPEAKVRGMLQDLAKKALPRL